MLYFLIVKQSGYFFRLVLLPQESARVVPGSLHVSARRGCKCKPESLLSKTLQRYDIRRHRSDDGWRCRAICGLFYGSPSCSTMARTCRGVNVLQVVS